MPDEDDSPRLYDRPCVEVDSIGETGHKFFCECNVPDQKQTHKGISFNFVCGATQAQSKVVKILFPTGLEKYLEDMF